MDTFTHILIAFFFSILSLLKFHSMFLVFYAIFMGALPDLDVFLNPLNKIYKSEAFSHKGGSHSFTAALLVSFLFGFSISIIFKLSLILYWIIGLLFYSLHIILDTLASSRVPIFYPFIKKKFRLFIVRAINFYLAIVSGFLMLFLFILFYFVSFNEFLNVVHIIVDFYIVYFIFKILSKIWFTFQYPTKLFIPGTLLFSYLMYEKETSENKITYKLTKKSFFTNKKKVLIKSELSKGSDVMYFFSRSKDLISNYSFFSKWDGIIPVWKRNENRFEIYLLLAESFSNYRAYHLKVIFDVNTREIIDSHDGFDNLLDDLETDSPIEAFLDMK